MLAVLGAGCVTECISSGFIAYFIFFKSSSTRKCQKEVNLEIEKFRIRLAIEYSTSAYRRGIGCMEMNTWQALA